MECFTEKEINLFEALHVPNFYYKERTKEYNYWFRTLLQKIDSSIVFKNFPKSWDNDFFMLTLWARGYLAIFKTFRKDLQKFADDNIVFQPCNLSGREKSFYYQPTIATIAHPIYNANLEIGKQCEILKLTPDYLGIFDVLEHYATQLAEATKGVDMGLINAKTPLILYAQNEAQSETLKKVYDKVQRGESLVVYKDISDNDEIIPSKVPFESWTQDFKETFIVPELLDTIEKILNSFYVEIGIGVTVDKKERLITNEAEFVEAQSQARISCWVETLRESLKKINALYNLNLEVEYASTVDTDRDGEGTKPTEQVNN